MKWKLNKKTEEHELYHENMICTLPYGKGFAKRKLEAENKLIKSFDLYNDILFETLGRRHFKDAYELGCFIIQPSLVRNWFNSLKEQLDLEDFRLFNLLYGDYLQEGKNCFTIITYKEWENSNEAITNRKSKDMACCFKIG